MFGHACISFSRERVCVSWYLGPMYRPPLRPLAGIYFTSVRLGKNEWQQDGAALSCGNRITHPEHLNYRSVLTCVDQRNT